VAVRVVVVRVVVRALPAHARPPAAPAATQEATGATESVRAHGA
jgi:hypothetical protein